MNSYIDDVDRFYGMSVEEIREELKNLPLADPNYVAQMQFTGSGMTEHGFMIGSGASFVVEEGEDGLTTTRSCTDEAEIIYQHVLGMKYCREKNE